MSKKKSVQDFQFGSRIGEGSYSTVYKGVDVQSRKVFAIKVLSKKHIVKEKKIKYVNIEKITLNRLGRHPGIVTLYYTFQDDNSLYFVIDLAEHGELLTIIRKMGSLSEACSKYYMLQLVDAVDFMHKKGVIHRDLKPENILVNSEKKLMITDFGAAKVLNLDDKGEIIEDETTEEAFAKGSFVGTAEYVSPELLKFNKCGFESDVWAIGCILYQFVVGVPPFKGKTEYQTFEKIVGLQYQWPNFFIPELLKDLVFKLLQSDPKDRLSMKNIQAHPWFNRVNWNDKAKIWGVGPPNLEPYRPLVEQTLNQNTTNMNKMVLTKKLPAATVKKNLLNSTINQIRNDNSGNFLFNGANEKPRQSPIRTQAPLQPITTNDSPIRRQQPQSPLVTNQESTQSNRTQQSNTTSPIRPNHILQQPQVRQPPKLPFSSPNGNKIIPQATSAPENQSNFHSPIVKPYSAQQLNHQSPNVQKESPQSYTSSPQQFYQKLQVQEQQEGKLVQNKQGAAPPLAPAKPGPVPFNSKSLAPAPSIIPKSQIPKQDIVKPQQVERNFSNESTQLSLPPKVQPSTIYKPSPPPQVLNKPVIVPKSVPSTITSKNITTVKVQPKISVPKTANVSRIQQPKIQPPKIQPPKLQPPKIQPPKPEVKKTPLSSPKPNGLSSPKIPSPVPKNSPQGLGPKPQSPKPAISSGKSSPVRLNRNLPTEVSNILQKDENILKLDYINESELIYSNLKSLDPTSSLSKLSEGSIGLDDLLINEIIKKNDFLLEHDLKRIALTITDLGFLHLFKVEKLDTLKFYMSIDLTDKLFAMYDYEFSEFSQSGYLILEVLKMDKLIFLSPLSPIVKRDLKEFSRIRLGTNISWIDSLLRTKELLKNRSTPKKPSALPKPSSVPSSGSPSISSNSTRNTTPIQQSKSKRDSASSNNGTKKQVKPKTKQEIIKQNRKFAGGAAAAAFNASR